MVLCREQQGTDEKGDVPDEEEKPVPVSRRIRQMIQHEDGQLFYADMTYDGEGRITKLHSYKKINGVDQDLYKEEFTYSGNQIVSQHTGWDEGYVGSGTTTYTLFDGRVVSDETKDSEDNLEKSTYKYDEAGRLTEYKWSHSNGSWTNSYYQIYHWDGNLITSVDYHQGSTEREIRCEYYNPAVISPKPVGFFIQHMSMDEYEFGLPSIAMYGWSGQALDRYMKKITISGDTEGKDNGAVNYRYETDEDGYLLRIYSSWIPAGKTAGTEYLIWEVVYE